MFFSFIESTYSQNVYLLNTFMKPLIAYSKYVKNFLIVDKNTFYLTKRCFFTHAYSQRTLHFILKRVYYQKLITFNLKKQIQKKWYYHDRIGKCNGKISFSRWNNCCANNILLYVKPKYLPITLQKLKSFDPN